MDNMSGFSAEVSLYTSSGHYRSNRNRNTINAIHPAAAIVGDRFLGNLLASSLGG